MSYKEFIKYFPDFSFLKPVFDQDLIQYKTWGKGEFICHNNSKMDNIYFFVSGSGRVYRLLNNGKEVMYDFYKEGQIAGDVEFLLNTETTCSLESSDNLSGYILPISIISSELHSKLFFLLSKVVANKLIKSSIQNSIKLGYTLEERLAYYLLYQYKDDVRSMSELATSLGTTYRHLSRIFKKFESENILLLENKRVTILTRNRLVKLSETIKEDVHG
ncbi:MAG: Crp/Fnr family transcriptional regulator [Spirochaetaceae bacterium]